MRITKICIMFAAAVALLGPLQSQSAPKTADKQVERPFKIQGNLTMVVDLATCVGGICNAVTLDWGEATHWGRYSNPGTGTYNIVTNGFNGSGVVTAANGDQIYWKMEPVYQGGVVITHHIMWTGGTGRFMNVTGGFYFTEFITTGYSVEPPIATLKATYKGEGTIKY